MDHCTIWSGGKTKDGYGQLRYGGVVRRAHRVAYCEHHGIPLESISGQVILHECDNPACVNPSHLKLGTQADNIADMYNKGRAPCRSGASNPNSKMTDWSAAEVRKLKESGLSYSKIASMFGVSKSTIARIVKGETF